MRPIANAFMPSLLFMALISSFAFGSSAEAAYCKSYVTQHAQAKYKPAATSKAIGAWSYYVATHFGSSWSSWKYAASRSVSCRVYGYYVTCWAKAKPCRSGGGYGGGRDAAPDVAAPDVAAPDVAAPDAAAPDFAPDATGGGGGSGY